MIFPVIDLNGVEVTYNSGGVKGFKALRGVSLAVRPGEFVAIMGTSGSGKTTLANIIGLLARPSLGAYMFEGRPTTALSDLERSRLRASSIGFIFQDYVLIDHFTALENVALALTYTPVSRREALQRAAEGLEMLGVGSKRRNYPSQLSGGQKQRVAIARALINNPKLILADEPAGALDSKSRIEVLAALQELNSMGTTIVMVTHSLEDAKAAKRLIRIEEGQIVEDCEQRDRIRFSSATRDKGDGAGAREADSALLQLVISSGIRSAPELVSVLERGPHPDSLRSLVLQLDPSWLSDPKLLDFLLGCAQAKDSPFRPLVFGALIRGWKHLASDRDRKRAAALLDRLKATSWEEGDWELILSELGKASTEAVLRWIPVGELLQSPSSRVRSTALRLLRNPAIRESIQFPSTMDFLLRDPDARVRSNAIELASELGASLGNLARYGFARDESPRVRAAWSRMLLEQGKAQEAFNVIGPMLRSDDPAENRAGAYVLASSPGIDLVRALEQALEGHPERMQLINTITETMMRARGLSAGPGERSG
jgi:putative ABC transport system ATP-binding protein